MQLLVLAHLAPTSGARVVGFKEIRWGFNSDLDDLELLFQVFPKGRAIFNHRDDTGQQAASRVKAFNKKKNEESATDMENHNQAMERFHRRFPHRTFMFPVENFTVGAFNDLLHWLGEDENCRYTDVAHMNENEGYSKEDIATATGTYLKCKL